MRSNSTEKNNPVTNELAQHGWLVVEKAVDASHFNTTEQQLRDKLASLNREGLTLISYVIGSRFNKLVTGKYFDQDNRSSRLLGSRRGGDVSNAYFHPDGELNLWALGPLYRHPRLGGRSAAGVKRT